MTPAGNAAVVSIAPQAEERPLREVMRDILDNEPGLTQAQVAREIGTGVSSATISQWLNGNYAGDNAKVEARVAAWLDAHHERRSRAGLPSAPEWIATPTTAKIEAGLRYAQLAQDVVVIFGVAGVSKTKTCEHYVTQAPGVVMVTMSPSTEGVLGCLSAIANAAGLKEPPHSVPRLHEAIVQRLRATSGLLIVDEAQHLGIKALDEIRSIQDQCFIGMALVGNEFVYSRLSRAAFLDRLLSRVGKVVKVGRATSADIDLLIEAWKINDSKCKTEVREIAKRVGALRSLTKVLRLAASFAAAKGEAICCEHIKAAARDLGTFE